MTEFDYIDEVSKMENKYWYSVKPAAISNAVYIMTGVDLESASIRASVMFDHPMVNELTWQCWQKITGCDIPVWHCGSDLVRGDLSLPKYKDYQVIIIFS